ncbi:transcription elongation factor GreA [Ureaplasma urealyticum]|uniref:Transcription elongation factor GreA n=1 Tax=Ureaplasma urealyticum TaxID=2130 RepID=A0AAX1QZE0_UREUR|nr:transcription elongation factor GreA [Ureaplasma urealyticum]EEH02187.1 transcription elongation factor GreA [Ureaplasma urealyticum serovar 2 str. ATCC 27814]QDI63667.1 transcription elongation factor GreA [Ureaplasma urealyticum]RCJ01465.1 transcription elongation factor GreA [Ureaplasma urealyticum]RCT49906.1 transcription elongation factor GreA [Ureaplasma urealyticum]
MAKYTISKHRLEELQLELREILDVKWPAITKQLQDAREQGDLSENADYDAAKNEQAALKKRKDEIEEILENYELIEDVMRSTDEVSIGSTIEIYNYQKDRKEVITLVGSMDSDPFANKISMDTPLGKAVVKQKEGSEVTVHTLASPYKVKIIKIID